MPSVPTIQQWENPNQRNWNIESLLSDDEIKTRIGQPFKWTGVETMRLWKSRKATTNRSRCGGKFLEPFLHPNNDTQLAPTQDPSIGRGKHEFTIVSGSMYLPAHLTASANGRTVHEGTNACHHCQHSPNVRYPKCITAKDRNGNSTLNGACAACAYGTHWQKCSFVKKETEEGANAVVAQERDRTQPCENCGYGIDDTFYCACP